MTERLHVTVDRENDGKREGTNEFSVELADTGDVPPNHDWIPFHLEVETRVEGVWYKFLADVPDHSALTAYNNFRESEQTWVWFEIGNMLAEARIQLCRARGYKEVEKDFGAEGERRDNRLRTVHIQKMNELHQALRDIKKLEDLILRVIFEGVGRALPGIDTNNPQWERRLTVERVGNGLARREDNAILRSLADDEYDQLIGIVGDLDHNKFAEMAQVWTYRHELEHRMPRSVDYAEMYPYYKPGQNPDWQFMDLFNASITVYEHYFGVLQRLASLALSNHPLGRRD